MTMMTFPVRSGMSFAGSKPMVADCGSGECCLGFDKADEGTGAFNTIRSGN